MSLSIGLFILRFILVAIATTASLLPPFGLDEVHALVPEVLRASAEARHNMGPRSGLQYVARTLGTLWTCTQRVDARVEYREAQGARVGESG